VSSIADGEKLLKRACEATKAKYGLTVFSGLKRFYEYYITFAQIHAYVSTEEVKNHITSGRGPITLKLLTPDQQSILKETKRTEGFSVCSPIQVVIDLFCSGIGRSSQVSGANSQWQTLRFWLNTHIKSCSIFLSGFPISV